MLQNKITSETHALSLDTDVTAAVSEDIAQLTSQGVAQSRELQAKESLLARQQQAIRLRTEDIARGTQVLHDQQATLLLQNAELEALVHEHFALREETHEGARHLLAIADAVRLRRDSLLGRDCDLLAPVAARLDNALEEAAVQDAQLESSVQAEARALALQQTDAAADLLATSRHWEKPVDNAPPDANTLAQPGAGPGAGRHAPGGPGGGSDPSGGPCPDRPGAGGAGLFPAGLAGRRRDDRPGSLRRFRHALAVPAPSQKTRGFP